MSLLSQPRLSEEVQEAVASGKPVVALETTIISHGFPFPENLEVAQRCEQAVRRLGAIPATLGIVNGRLCAGLSAGELERFARETPIPKVNLSNGAFVRAKGGLGSLTVAACLQACSVIGLQVFATGGLGGVHRGWQTHPDVSADLMALSRYRVATVCAGAKSILDLPATLEVLETLGVPVLGWKTDWFPRFYCPVSDFPVDGRVDSIEELVGVLDHHWGLDPWVGGVVVAVPVLAEDALDPVSMNQLVEAALDQAAKSGVQGRSVTPFVLKWLAENSEGRCVRANRSLVVHNCAVAANLSISLRNKALTKAKENLDQAS